MVHDHQAQTTQNKSIQLKERSRNSLRRRWSRTCWTGFWRISDRSLTNRGIAKTRPCTGGPKREKPLSGKPDHASTVELPSPNDRLHRRFIPTPQWRFSAVSRTEAGNSLSVTRTAAIRNEPAPCASRCSTWSSGAPFATAVSSETVFKRDGEAPAEP